MRSLLAAAGILVALAPAASASTATRLARMERHDKAQAREIDRLNRRLDSAIDAVVVARADANDAQLVAVRLYSCLRARSAGTATALTDGTVALFAAPDRLFWNPVTATAIVAGGPDYLAYINPACVGITTTDGPLFPEMTR